MACRVRVRLSRGELVVETSALVNSGFEADTPDIMVPVEAAKRLGLWPPRRASLAVMDTGGGEVSVPYYELAVDLELLLPDRAGRRMAVSVMVNPHVREVVLSDYVASMLGIMLLDLKRGRWRLADDPPGKVRETVEPEEW